MKIYIDGKYYGERDAKVSVFDHGLLYGDGIFEGIRAYNGRVFKLKEHIDRLFYSAKAILLTIPISHQQMMEAVTATCRENKLRDGYIRLLVTRGPGTLGLNPNRCKNPSVIVNADEVFLTGTGAELVPVVKVDGRVIGSGKPGPVTCDLVKRYHELVQSTGEPIFPDKKRR